jgi:hypothetical protein
VIEADRAGSRSLKAIRDGSVIDGWAAVRHRMCFVATTAAGVKVAMPGADLHCDGGDLVYIVCATDV